MGSEQIELEHASRTRDEIEGLRAQINILSCDNKVRNNDLRELTQRFEQTSAELNSRFEEKNNEWCSQLDAACADHQEKQEEQNQAEISHRTLRTTLAEEISSQRKFIEAESVLRITQSSDRDSTEPHLQLQDVE